MSTQTVKCQRCDGKGALHLRVRNHGDCTVDYTYATCPQPGCVNGRVDRGAYYAKLANYGRSAKEAA